MEADSQQGPYSRVEDLYLEKNETRERESVDTKGVVRDRGCGYRRGQMVRLCGYCVRRWRACSGNQKGRRGHRGLEMPRKVYLHTMPE